MCQHSCFLECNCIELQHRCDNYTEYHPLNQSFTCSTKTSEHWHADQLPFPPKKLFIYTTSGKCNPISITMHNTSSSSYYDDFIKKNKRKSGSYMVDRESYVNFLELQLEKVSAATLTVQTFDSRIEQLQTHINLIDEKVLNISRVTHLSQQVIEKLQKNFEDMEIKMERELNTRIAKARIELESRVKKLLSTDEHSAAKVRSDLESKFKKQEQLMEEWMLKLNAHISNHSLHGESSRVKEHNQKPTMDDPQISDILSKTVTVHEEKIMQLTHEFQQLQSDVLSTTRDLEHRMLENQHNTEIEDQKQFVKREMFDKVEKLIMVRLSSVEQISQSIQDDLEHMQERQGTSTSFHKMALQDNVTAKIETMSQTIRNVERLVDSNLFEMQQEVKKELAELKEVREEVATQNEKIMEMRGDGTLILGNEMIMSHFQRMIEDKLIPLRSELDDKLSTHSVEQKENINKTVQEILVLLADKYKEAKQNKRVNVKLLQNRAHSPQNGAQKQQLKSVTKTQVSSAETNCSSMESSSISLSGADSAQEKRKRQLKDLYKELAQLELEVIKGNST